MVDRITERWMRNASDVLAVANGCRFDEERAEHVCEFFERELIFYEGDMAGEPFVLLDWQRDLLSRAFGWVRWSEEVHPHPRWVRRFTKVSVWTPKKNGKSPLCAGVGLYLLAADGEQGAKVFSAARDGKQAGIIHMHARQMVLRSQNLNAECRINQGTGRILHLPTSSYYDILSADNIEGQHGLNGSVMIDETHVVDQRLIDVLEYMGATRSEPMQFEVSSAGNNPEGYGKKQFDYGRLVEQGEIKDDGFLWVSYGIDSDLSDEECMDPKLWKAVNPSWGVTIKPSEFAASAERARSRGISEWQTFKMLRLNQWQRSTHEWLRERDWRACSDPFELPDIADMPLAFGLDLSKTRDMSALALAAVEADQVWLKVWLWITEAYAERHAHQARFAEWEERGDLTIIPGDVIQQSWIKERCLNLLADLQVSALCYDKTYAQEFTEWLTEHHPHVELIEFPQSSAYMEKPIDDFEALVVEHRLHHDGNQCLTWQAGHCGIKENARGHRILVKPKRDAVQKIDGMVASVMAAWGASTMQAPITGRLFVA